VAKDTPKWAVLATWRRYSLHRTKGEAEEALKAWKSAQEAENHAISGSLGTGYRATAPGGSWSDDKKRAEQGLPPIATFTASVVKLADHPICYIGVVSTDVQRLRAMEEAENPAFDEYSARAKAISEEWRHVEAL
jgi:hypothetical protein